MLSINPDAASRDDVARLATEWLRFKEFVLRIKSVAKELDEM
jgi:hypothetical protein